MRPGCSERYHLADLAQLLLVSQRHPGALEEDVLAAMICFTISPACGMSWTSAQALPAITPAMPKSPRSRAAWCPVQHLLAERLPSSSRRPNQRSVCRLRRRVAAMDGSGHRCGAIDRKRWNDSLPPSAATTKRGARRGRRLATIYSVPTCTAQSIGSASSVTVHSASVRSPRQGAKGECIEARDV